MPNPPLNDKGFYIGVAPWVESGYGHQIGHSLPFFQSQGYDMWHYAYRGIIGNSTRWPDPESGALVLPQGRMSKFGWEILPFYIAKHSADFVFSLCNLFVFDEIKSLIAAEGWPWFHWTPVDCSPLGAPDFNILNISGIRPIAMSKFGQAELIDWGFLDTPYLPHSIDTQNVFRPPTYEEYLASRAQFSISEDVFVIGVNAANESSADRKSLVNQLEAFAAFHSRHPNSLMYMWNVAYRHPVGLDLVSVMTRLEILDAVMFPEPQQYNSNMITKPELVSQFYWPCDIGSLTSKGEGFGLPIIEFQACARPMVGTNCSTFPELIAPGEYGGYKVPGQREWSTLDSSFWTVPFTSNIEEAYELLHHEWLRSRDAFIARQIAARVHSGNYDTAFVQQHHWPAVLDYIQATVSRRKSDSAPSEEPLAGASHPERTVTDDQAPAPQDA